jgi:hypothetical protein
MELGHLSLLGEFLQDDGIMASLPELLRATRQAAPDNRAQ